ncbi:bestrophin family protein [Pendulispora brunnea]|uniref:Bestrophin family protein n=1 Tax=Pendulispora brunnea TaxID=2905690 RepID=A0ABZ2KEA4_9BACT
MIDYEAKNWLAVAFRFRGTIGPRLLGRVLIVGVVGFLAAGLNASVGFKIPAIAHTLIGVALGLLLVFRTNASYDRYWEGRKLLGTMVNRSRDMARQVAAFVGTRQEPEVQRAVEDVQRYLSAFFALAVQSLRSQRDLSALGERLTPEERAILEPKKARAPVVASFLSKRIEDLARRGVLAPHHVLLLDPNITALLDALGGCERIVRTPIPFAYAQHIKLAVLLFTLTVPFAMADATRWYTPMASAILAFALIGIDEIGVEIEDPFGEDPNDLPIDRLAETIASSAEDILHTRAL